MQCYVHVHYKRLSINVRMRIIYIVKEVKQLPTYMCLLLNLQIKNISFKGTKVDEYSRNTSSLVDMVQIVIQDTSKRR